MHCSTGAMRVLVPENKKRQRNAGVFDNDNHFFHPKQCYIWYVRVLIGYNRIWNFNRALYTWVNLSKNMTPERICLYIWASLQMASDREIYYTENSKRRGNLSELTGKGFILGLG